MIRESNDSSNEEEKNNPIDSEPCFKNSSFLPKNSNLKSFTDGTERIQSINLVHHAEIGRVDYKHSNKIHAKMPQGENKIFQKVILCPIIKPRPIRQEKSLLRPHIKEIGANTPYQNSAFQRVLPKRKKALIEPSRSKNSSLNIFSNNPSPLIIETDPIEVPPRPLTISPLPTLQTHQPSLNPQSPSTPPFTPPPAPTSSPKFHPIPKIFHTEQIQRKPLQKSTPKPCFKTTEYYYLLQRKTFRMMKKFYKEKFENFSKKYKFKRKIKEISREKCDQCFREYVQQEDIFEFGGKRGCGEEGSVERIDGIVGESIVEAIQLLILCDRYKKAERATRGMDFTVCRSLLNHYNQKNLGEFLSSKANCLITALYLKRACFVDSSDPIRCETNECLKQKDVDPEKLMREMKLLFKSSIERLSPELDLSPVKVKINETMIDGNTSM
ncbi:unnamed protein product [Moneuplotes crassus]|uniref:Uncharacterized protein n=1 Tax=Euplotes crassus TaxID=5936 RepID=A0AAD1XFP8_EUPCR|nr:unnamed protein product [Moneuplotes crassus]